MKEIIKEIKQDIFYHKTRYEGFIIKTNKQVIQVGIEESQQCCECSGYLTTNDNINYFLEAELKEIIEVDEYFNTKEFDVKAFEAGFYMENTQMIFINFNTNKGTLQFIAYNEHNGYYSHNVFLSSTQLKIDEDI